MESFLSWLPYLLGAAFVVGLPVVGSLVLAGLALLFWPARTAKLTPAPAPTPRPSPADTAKAKRLKNLAKACDLYDATTDPAIRESIAGELVPSILRGDSQPNEVTT